MIAIESAMFLTAYLHLKVINFSHYYKWAWPK